MSKRQAIALVVVVALGAGLYLYRGPVFEILTQRLTADMFVAADTDAFDPGIPVGSTFPSIRALDQGRTVTTVADLVGEAGLVFFALRSADW